MGVGCLVFVSLVSPVPSHQSPVTNPQSPIPDQQNLPRNGKSPERLSISFPTQYSGLSSLNKFYRLICRGEIFSCNLYFWIKQLEDYFLGEISIIIFLPSFFGACCTSPNGSKSVAIRLSNSSAKSLC
ncbi:hypothetical protein NIES2107_01990 [Nostoc carneum NIES-2107]|nr:hypothetical protein NIES2107_01990 [Nostoc carneum NIES-2107]